MTKKIKMTEAAKDLQISAKELVAFLEKHLNVKKHTGSTISERELNLALEYYSQQSHVGSFDDYFANGVRPGTEKPKREPRQRRQPEPEKKAPEVTEKAPETAATSKESTKRR